MRLRKASFRPINRIPMKAIRLTVITANELQLNHPLTLTPVFYPSLGRMVRLGNKGGNAQWSSFSESLNCFFSRTLY